MTLTLSTLSDHTLLYKSACYMLKMLRSGEIGAEELLKLHWSQMDQLNPELNAIVVQNREAALIDARQVDDGKLNGVLAGLPMTIKDSFEVVGMRATCGMPQWQNYYPSSDATAVTALRQAGAVIYGKTNVPYACGDHQSYNDVYGQSNNPWNLLYTTGGSSGGSAAAVAAGMTALELGSDIGGSIRCPAHFCGVYGHKTTHGLLSAHGHIPPTGHDISELSVIGPLARDPYDLSLSLNVLLGLYDNIQDDPLPPPRHHRLQDFRVGLWLDAYPLDDAYRQAILDFVDDLKHLGVSVNPHAHPNFDPNISHEIYMETLFGVMGSRMDSETLDDFIALVNKAGDKPYHQELLNYVSHPHHLSKRIRERRLVLGRAWASFFQSYDVLICPITPTVAFPHDHFGGHGPAAQLQRVIMVNGSPCPYLDNLKWPGLVTVANLPATAMPTGYFSQGLPAGVQLIGPLGEDRTPLHFAELLSDRRPALAIPNFKNM